MVSVQDAETSTLRRLSDDDDDEPSSESEAYEEGDLLSAAMDDDVTAQLAAAGWQFKHINGDFPFFFAFSLFFIYLSLFNYLYLRIKRIINGMLYLVLRECCLALWLISSRKIIKLQVRGYDALVIQYTQTNIP